VLWRYVRIVGLPLEALASSQNMMLLDDSKETMAQRLKDTPFVERKMKGPICYCVAFPIQCLVESLLSPERRILPVTNLYTTPTRSTVYISLPSIVCDPGV
ncbi:lactate dehydrogenase, partial [Staphylococcus pseudintermedius]